jgi:AcrR family transcriptional regulator
MTSMPTKPDPKSPEPTKKSGTSYHHGDLRKALIKTGLSVIREQGAHALSLREAARMAGVSEAAPYRHFTNKESLLAAIAEEGFKRLHADLLEATQGFPNNPLARLHALADRYVGFALEETDHFRTMYSSSLVPPHAETHPDLSKAALATFDELVKVVEDCQKTGSISSSVDAKVTSTRLWASIYGMTLLLIDQQMAFLGVTVDQSHAIIRDQLDSHLDGLKDFHKA